MILMWLLICLLAWTQPGLGVYHTNSASWFNITFDHSDAFFGYSITYEPTSKRLIVSAPRASQIGEVYSCDLDAKTNQCTALPKTIGQFHPLYEHNLWFGATVKAGPSYFVTCAPLHFTSQKDLKILDFDRSNAFGTFSRCLKYWNLTQTPVPYSTLKRLTLSDRMEHATLFEHAMDSFGWSIDIDGDDIIIGGPAMFTGRAAKYDNRVNTDPISLIGFMNEKDTKRRVDYNFGYSVAVGHFSMKKEKVYAIGSPYGKGGFGKVSFYTFSKKKANLNGNSYAKSYLDLQTNDEFAVGSMFGAVLCAAQLTNDSSASALLVGAPTYASSTQRYNQGAVYFYAPDRKLPLNTCYKKIVGPKDNGFFGSAIARLGDFNGDGMDEIAIAAPYESNGAGAVYIYSSQRVLVVGSSADACISNKKEENTWLQRIVPSQSAGMVTSFGLSLSAVQDYDDNGCNELAIGAPEKNLVMFLKCIASVTIKLRTEIPKDLSLRDDVINPNRNDHQFIFKSCIDVDFPEKPNVIDAHINVSVHIDHQTAKLEAKEKWYEVFLDRTQKVMCKTITVLAPKNGKYQFPIGYRIKATQLNPPEQTKASDFMASRVALNDLSKLTDSGNIWLIECADKDKCKPNLKLTKSLSVTPESPYVIGSPERVKMDMSVNNEGEAAYGACVRVTAAAGVAVAGVPSDCERPPNRYDVLVCTPLGALRKADAWNITDVTFDLSSLNSEHKTTNISIAVDENCDNENLKWEVVPIPLKADLSNIFVKGITGTGVSNALNMSKDEVEGKRFEHSYAITSAALTTWVNVGVTIVRQNRSFIEYDPIYISSGDSPFDPCSVDPSNDTIFTCLIEKLNSKQSAKITVPMKIIDPEKLDIAIKEKQNTQFTSVTIALNDIEKRNSSVTTTFNLGGQVKTWIIVVASLVGLLLLLLIFFALTKCGFFEREKKTELDNVRKSIRRQTVMRRTMMEGGLPQGGDRRSLLAPAPQETADQAAARDKRVRLDSNATRNK